MSKGIVVIDNLPEYCDYCPMARLFGVAGGIECKAAPEGHCVVGYGLRMKRPEWCPIKPAPNDDWIPVEDERLWDILFEEACVEGEQAKRIYNRLKETFGGERSEMDGKF